MAGKRTYGDRCGVARALEIVGERWALLVVRELLLGPKRFTDLRTGLPKIGPDILAQRLRELEESDVIVHRLLPPPASAQVYELTARGRELEPLVLALGRWGSRSKFPADAAAFGPDSAVLALKTLFSPAVGPLLDQVLDKTFVLCLDGQSFILRPHTEALEVHRGDISDPEARIATEPAVLASVLWHDGQLADELRAGRIRITGARSDARSLLKLFPLPD